MQKTNGAHRAIKLIIRELKLLDIHLPQFYMADRMSFLFVEFDNWMCENVCYAYALPPWGIYDATKCWKKPE